MITISNLSFHFGGQLLFKDVDLKFTPGNCYGIIGANGAGKSTFLKILCGELEPSTGEVSIPDTVRMSVLRQDHFAFDEYTVLDTVLMGNKRLYEVKVEKDAIYEKEEFTEEDGIRASELEAEFAELNGWEADSEASRLIQGLGMSDDQLYSMMSDLKESEKVAVYNELTSKQSMQLRLICEEIDGMLPNIIDEFDGDFWIDFEDGVCRVNVSLRFAEFTADKKKGLIGIARNKKNAAAVGIVGKIRSALENVFLDENSFGGADLSLESRCMVTEYYSGMEFYAGMNYSSLWSLEQYRNSVKKEEKTEEWDELEKSVLVSLADDIIVGVKGKQADIIVIKKMA